MTPLLLGSANLFRPGLRPNGPSNIASRHRPKRPQQQSHATSQVAGNDMGIFPTLGSRGKENKQAWRDHLYDGAPLGHGASRRAEGGRVRRVARLRLNGPPLKKEEEEKERASIELEVAPY